MPEELPQEIEVVKRVSPEKTTTKGNPYHFIEMESGETYTLFKPDEGKMMAWEDRKRLQEGIEINATYEAKGKYRNLKFFEVVGGEGKQDKGEADWDLIGLLKTRCAVACAYIEAGHSAGEYAEEAEKWVKWIYKPKA